MAPTAKPLDPHTPQGAEMPTDQYRDMLREEADFPSVAAGHRATLIAKKHTAGLTPQEQQELDALQATARQIRQAHLPEPLLTDDQLAALQHRLDNNNPVYLFAGRYNREGGGLADLHSQHPTLEAAQAEGRRIASTHLDQPADWCQILDATTGKKYTLHAAVGDHGHLTTGWKEWDKPPFPGT